MSRLSSPGPSRERAGFDRVAFALVAAGAVLRFALLGQQSFWHDEIHSMLNAGGVESPTWALTAGNTHGPLYLVLLRLWIAMVGHAEGPVRALSALFGVAGLVLFHRVLVRFADRATARFGLALLAFSPYHLGYSQEARNYSLLFAVGLLAMLAVVREIERRDAGSFVLALLALAATCLANLSGFFLAAVAGVLAWTTGRPRGYPLRRFALMAVLLAVLLAPWIRAGAMSTGKFSVGTPPPRSDVILAKGESPPGLASMPFAFYDFTLGRSLGPTVDEMKQQRFAAVVPHLPYLVPAAMLVAILVLLGLAAAGVRARAVLVPWLALPIVLVALLSAVNLKAANSRYAFLAFAPYVALLAIGIGSLRTRALRLGSLGALLALFVWSDVRYFTDPHTWKPDARGAGRLLAREAKPGDAILVYALDYPVRYYTPERVALVVPPGDIFASDSAAAGWLDRNVGARRLWLVECEGWWYDRTDRMRMLCDRTRTRDGAWPLEKLPVHRYAAGAPR